MSVLLILSGLVLIWLAISLRHVPADPPHIAVVVFLGKRLRKVREEGYRYFPLYPLLYSAILIDMRKRHIDLPPQKVRTSELAEVEITVSLTWTPSRDYAIEFLDQSGDEGVNSTISTMVQAGLRQWATSGDWISALSVKDEVVWALAKSFLDSESALDEDEKLRLIPQMRLGAGSLDVRSMGVELNRMIVGQIRPIGELAYAAERMAKEMQSVRGLQIKIDFATEAALKITKALNCSPQQAFDLVQTESGVVPKKITDLRLNVSPETLSVVSQLIESMKH